MRALIACVVLAACTPWRPQDTVLETAFIASIAVDWHQTMTITGDCSEANPVIGPCGHSVPPEIYFPITVLVHAVVARVLPPPWRELFQAFTIGLEVSTIWGNQMSGVSAWKRELR